MSLIKDFEKGCDSVLARHNKNKQIHAEVQNKKERQESAPEACKH